MSGRFQPLEVITVRPTTRDAVEVSLQPRAGDFTFQPGQYLTFRQAIDGVEIRRSYSICCAPGDGLRVGIKRVEGGAFSTWANARLAPGMVLEALTPQGRFGAGIPARPGAAGRHHLLFAGGSGITPVLSIMGAVLEGEPNSRVTLVYANRGVCSIMFREEIEDLKNRHMGRLAVAHVLESDAQEAALFHGRVDGAKCAALLDRWIDPGGVDMAYVCGPEPMMLAVRDGLRAAGLTEAQIRIELFKGTQAGRLPQRAAAAQAAGGAAVAATVTLDGVSRAIRIGAGQTVLEAGLASALDLPFACRAGVCSTCRCRLTEGEVEMAANHALGDDEVARGYILSCQSYPVSARIGVDYDQ